jgi:hypothetical protein
LKESLKLKLIFERKIFGPTKEADNTWRIKANDELNKSIQNRNIINYIQAQRLSWFGHSVYRMLDDRLVNKLFKWEPIASRSQGRQFIYEVCLPVSLMSKRK